MYLEIEKEREEALIILFLFIPHNPHTITLGVHHVQRAHTCNAVIAHHSQTEF